MKIRQPDALYGEFCPVCKGDFGSFEIDKGLCQYRKHPLLPSRLEEELKNLDNLFTKLLGSSMRNLQRLWALRVLNHISFPITAPTGTGKTVFGLIISLYLAEYKKKKSYLIFPTSILVKENHERLINFLKKAGFKLKIIAYHGDINEKEKEILKQKITDFEYDILITTNQFISKNFNLLRGKRFDYIFVDDVDALLKASKNVEKVLLLLGVKPSEIKNKQALPGVKRGTLMVSTATAKPGKSAELFFNILGFRVGIFQNLVRNIEDKYVKQKSKNLLLEILRILQDGGLIFASREEELYKLHDFLKEHGIKVGLAISKKKKDLEDFASGKINILLGVATSYGVMVRGLDYPERIKFAIFYGIPSVRIPLHVESPGEKLTHFLKTLLGNKFDENKTLRENLAGISKESLMERGIFVEDEYLVFPDITTYIQASGRTSRMYQGGITKGLSIVMDTPEKIDIFIKRATLKNILFAELNLTELKSLKKLLDEDRRKLRTKTKEEEIINPYLFIVESPNKVRQIASFFGKPNIIATEHGWIYEVTTGNHVLIIAPSFGHVSDLSVKRGLHGIETEKNNFKFIFTPIRKCKNCSYTFTDNYKVVKNEMVCPRCESRDIVDSFHHINFLRTLSYHTGNVIIATDPDREGEKIAWDLRNLLYPYAKSIKRSEFHEVTREAILEALTNLKEFDLERVKAQFVRRAEDRWLGFELSSFLQAYFKDKNLSAGRAQSPVLGWIIERTLESLKKKKFLHLKKYGVELPVEKEITGHKVKVNITLLEKEETTIQPPIPYSTDTLLEDANRILGMDTKETMASLQRLFEAGLITYHRTDSTAISNKGIEIARRLLEEEFSFRKYTGRGAHEGIRITKPIKTQDIKANFEEFTFSRFITEKDLDVYNLIERRFLAAFAPAATLIRATYRIEVIDISTIEDERYVKILNPGFLKYYPYRISIKDKLPEGEYETEVEIRERPLAYPYTEAEIVRLMKNKGIGRPSTYSTIISRLLERQYVKKAGSRLLSTERGETVHSLLSEYFGEYISEEVTYKLEEMLDKIEDKEMDFGDALKKLYHEIVEVMTRKERILRESL